MKKPRLLWVLATSIASLCPNAVLAGPLQREKLQTEFQTLIRGFGGRVGICVQDDSGQACVNSRERFSMQSVMKLIVSFAVLDRVDHDGWNLDETIVVRREDLSLYVQPIAKLVTNKGYRTTLGDLVRRAIVDSDCAAADILIAKLGGPKQVQGFLDRHSITDIRFDRDERHLQTEIVGLEWRPDFVDPEVLQRAVHAVPERQRDTAYHQYQLDPRDTATPSGMASLLYLLASGELLSPASTKYLLEVMSQTVTFPDRLKAGVSQDWKLAHKTGTSDTWKEITAATNDVGVLTAPDGHRISIAVFIADSGEASPKRAALIAKAARLTISDYR
jgi:beta-lactamase class A